MLHGQLGMQAELDLATAEIERAQQRLLALEQEKAGLMEGAERAGVGPAGTSKPRDQLANAAEEAVRAELSTQVQFLYTTVDVAATSYVGVQLSDFLVFASLQHTELPPLYSLSCFRC